MQIELDKTADALYIHLDKNQIVDSEEIRPGIVLDYDEADQVVGIEILHLSKRTPATEFSSFRFTC